MMTEQNHPVDLIPFFAAGTLDEEATREVGQHLAKCASCRNELQFMEALRTGVRHADATEGPGELAWERLRRALPHAANVGRSGREKRWLRAALAACLAVILVQTGLLLRSVDEDSLYQAAGNRMPGVVLQVRFREDAPIAAVEQLLEAVDGRIIDGPGALGVYRVRLEADPAAAAEIEQRVEHLRSRATIVEHVARD